ncbi:ATP-binding cassette sub-family C member 9-like [Saccoglossus kowalevskii]
MKYFTELRYYDYKFLLHYPGHAFKWTISGILIVVLFFSAAEGILTDLSRNDVTNLYLYIPQMLSLLGLIISLMYYHHMEYWDRPHLAWLLLLYWIMAIIGEVLAIFRVSQSIGFNYSILRLDVGIITTILYCCCAAVEINVLHKKIVCPFSEEKIFPKDFVETNLYYMQSYVNILSNATIWWLNWLVSLSRRQTIVLDDLGCLPGEFEGKRMIEAFNKVYRYEQQNCGKRVPSLWKVYWRTHYTMIIRVCVLRFIHSALTFVGPACLGKIVMYATEYYANDIKIYSSPFVTVDEFFSNGFILVLLIFTILVIRNTLYVYLYGISTIIGLQLKTALQNLVYEKTLRLPLQSTDDTTVGKTINHMSVDVTVIQFFFTLFLGFVLANPLHILIVSIWLLYLMGIAGVVGICVLLLIMPLALKTARMQHKLQHVNMHHSDIRVKKTNELLQGIKLLKLSGWEELFASNITNTRSEEMKLTSKVAMYFLLSGLLSQALPWIIALTMFAVYSQLDTEPLTPDVVFTTLVLINFLSQPLFVMPSFAKYTIDMVAATKRLAHFLSVDEIEGNAEHRSIVDGRMDSGCLHELTEEYEMNTIEMKPTTPLVQRVQRHNYQTTHEINQLPITATAGHIETDVAIEIVNGYFSWGRSTYEAVLNNINVKIKTGTLTIVVGKIGTGKSSLVSAILGEMNTISGSVTFNGRDNRIAYVAQKAWLQNASLRDNILFGETYVRERYNTVLQVCALNADLRSLPGGDMTEIGERGINMSGGQKHRICLARALYSNTDVVILDDPLSALDVHVSTHIMENAILGYLREQQRTVILVTHQIQHLEHANQVLVMENGQIIKKGDLREIRSHNIEMYRQWKELISTISESENENENELVTKKDLGLYSGTFKAPKPCTVSPPNNWPSRGSINIQNITARYAIGLDPVLTNVSVKIRPGEKVGICGRTGSGKSSLTLTLLRMIDIIEGRIIIDGIDISKISVLTLRRRMSIIPQDPVLFCGTLRFNLDPEEKYGDQDLWNALEIAQLKDCVLEMDEQLDTIVTDGGDNISTGQRQLICLARAFLRKSRILIMDEATASVDFETDATLQAVIATAFSDKTVLTIAHRISTILDSDTVLVLSEGRVVEYGTPQKLLRKDGGMFASLVNNTE